MSDFYFDESFSLPVENRGREIVYEGRLVRWGYSYRIHINVDGEDLIFEPDEERNFRAIVMGDQARFSRDTIEAIADALVRHLR